MQEFYIPEGELLDIGDVNIKFNRANREPTEFSGRWDDLGKRWQYCFPATGARVLGKSAIFTQDTEFDHHGRLANPAGSIVLPRALLIQYAHHRNPTRHNGLRSHEYMVTFGFCASVSEQRRMGEIFMAWLCGIPRSERLPKI